jgi:hypothetical protein
MKARVLILMLGLAAACGDRATRSRVTDASAGGGFSAPATAPPPADAPVRELAPAPEQAASSLPTSYWASQKLIRTAEMRIQVRDVTVALRLADSLAQSAGALIADSRTTQDGDGKQTADVVLRVPSAGFAPLLRALRGAGSVKAESIGTQDVTKEYADLETRLAVQEQTVARLRALLDSRTAKLADVLEVERELSRTVAELEMMKGQRRYYDQQIALSTIRLTLFERMPSRITQITKPIADALSSSLEVLGSSIGTIIYLVVALLPWVAVALGIVWLVPSLRRRLLSGRTGSEPPAA